MEMDQVCAPKPIRQKSNKFSNQSRSRILSIEIPTNQGCTSFINSPTSSNSSSDSNTTIQDSDISFSAFEYGIEQQQCYEEITSILSNNFQFDEFHTQRGNNHYYQRPKNPFYKNFVKLDDKENKFW